MINIRFLSIVFISALGCSGCLSGTNSPPDLMPDDYPDVARAKPVGGSLFSDGALILFEDTKAHRVGDVLTVLLVEKTDASKSSSTKTSKNSKVSNTGPTVLGRPITKGGTALLDGSVDATSAFDGEGSSTQSNKLDGSLTVTVVERFGNGHLQVRGRKNIQLNQGNEFVSISGVVRPQDISAANTVTSDRLAQAQITYSGRGPVNDANRMGFLTRFFNSPWWFQ